ncbi:hypothetical protein LAZ67_1004761 [Cordylochernes scorpioides]|uniref:Angiotensin-converting enzyme n=1 Tax=Cordylochernes scorpioides TaxID=51811 RepID=A0ABY6JZF1_9ARAC|nr:hypothetical protein LAZ67_1004761 [Cordylochernes scorpioides]
MLTVAYREATLDRSNVYRCYKMFSEGREDVNDEERAGRPSTSTTDEKINEVEKMILANRRITVREVAEDLNISIGSCHPIFINDLGMRRVAAKFVPKLLNCDKKQHRMNIANEMLDSVRDDPNLLQRVTTGDEAWVYGYDVETKAQSSQWKLLQEPRPNKARQVRSNVKVLLTVFLDSRGVVHHEFFPQGRTKRPELWKNKNWLFHHDNAPAHTSLLVRDFLAKNNTLMMPQPPYSPDLAPCDFFLFPKLKRPMKGRGYATLDEIKTASKEELKKIFKNDFLKNNCDNLVPQNLTTGQQGTGKNLYVTHMFRLADNFFKDLELEAVHDSFFSNSMLVRPENRKVVCHASAWDFQDAKDFRIFVSSRNAENLKKYWVGWRDATNKKIRSQYIKFVELSNEVARANGFNDRGELWREPYESLTFEDDMAEQWEILRPFYLEMHAYVRMKLVKLYGEEVVKPDGPIPAHLLGNMWGENWNHLQDITRPFPDKQGVDITPDMVRRNLTAIQMFKISEDFFTSLGMKRMTPEFWHYSVLEKQEEDLVTVRHMMGNIQYFQHYANQPFAFQWGANPSFHEAIGEVLELSVVTPKHLHKIGFLDKVENDTETEINFLMFMTDFDPGAKNHVPDNTPLIRHFSSYILQFQLQEVLCREAGHLGPLHTYGSHAAGDKLAGLLRLGISIPWHDALARMTGGSGKLDARPLLNYFAPLWRHIRDSLGNSTVSWTSGDHNICPSTAVGQDIINHSPARPLYAHLLKINK